MKTELTETLIRAIQNCAEDYSRSTTDESAVYKYLTTVLKLSDNDLDSIGLSYLIPEPNEPNEPEKKTWKVHVRETFEGDFEVEAADYDEAYDLACDLNYSLEDLGYTDCDLDVTEA